MEDNGTEVSTPLTIQRARDLFVEVGDDLEGMYNEIYRNAVAPCEYRNDNYLDALQLTSMMVRHTRDRFRMLTGAAGDVFIGEIRAHFRNMVERMFQSKKPKGTVRIIFLNSDKSCPEITALNRDYPNIIELEYATTVADVGHFIVADDMVRLEEPHGKLEGTGLASIINAKVLLAHTILANAKVEEFDRIWSHLRKSRGMAT